MVETASQIAAREALMGRRLRSPKLELDKKNDADGGSKLHPDSVSRRCTTKRGRHKQHKRKKDANGKEPVKGTKPESQPAGAVANGFVYALDFESQVTNSNRTRKMATGSCGQGNKKTQGKSQSGMIQDVVAKVEEMALDSKKPEKRKMRNSKKSELIRQGQSGWAGACFDRSPSPSLLPMPPSVLLQRACCQMYSNDINGGLEAPVLSSDD